jgi:hypothetical protein
MLAKFDSSTYLQFSSSMPQLLIECICEKILFNNLIFHDLTQGHQEISFKSSSDDLT